MHKDALPQARDVNETLPCETETKKCLDTFETDTSFIAINLSLHKHLTREQRAGEGGVQICTPACGFL